MSEEIPDWVDDSLLKKGDAVYPDRSFVRALATAGPPELSASTVADLVGVSNQSARERLNQLETRGVVQSRVINANGTRMYWLSHPRSSWAVPDDVRLPDTASDGSVLDPLDSFLVAGVGLLLGAYTIPSLAYLTASSGGLAASSQPALILFTTLGVVLALSCIYYSLFRQNVVARILSEVRSRLPIGS